AASFKTSSISSIDLGSGQPTVLFKAFLNGNLGVPIDVAFHSNGTVYFTNIAVEAGQLPTGSYLANPMVSDAAQRGTTPSGGGFSPGTGSVALSPDEKTLLVFGLGR